MINFLRRGGGDEGVGVEGEEEARGCVSFLGDDGL